MKWPTIWQATAVFSLVLVLVTIFVSVVANIKSDANYRICGTASAAQIGTSTSGELAATSLPFRIQLDGNADLIRYWVYTLSTMTAVRAIELHGPTVLGTHTGPLAAVLCGQATLTETVLGIPVCNLLSAPGEVSGIMERIYQGTTPSGAGIRTLATAIRARPERYYMTVYTTNKPTGTGAARGSLAGYCGTP